MAAFTAAALSSIRNCIQHRRYRPIAPAGWPVLAGDVRAEPCTGSTSYPDAGRFFGADRSRWQHADRARQYGSFITQESPNMSRSPPRRSAAGEDQFCMRSFDQQMVERHIREIRATPVTTRRQSCEFSSTLDLSTDVSFWRLPRAR